MARATWKFSIRRGQAAKDVTLGGGANATAGTDTIEVNVDQTLMTEAEFMAAWTELGVAVLNARYPAA